MKCSKCNYENQEHSNFCNNCGSKLEISNTTEENSNLQNENNKKKKIPALSWVSFGFLLMQLFCFLCQFSQIINKHIYSKLLFIFELPYVLVSLILAIISRIKNKDTMSLVVLIIDSVIISLAIIFVIIAVIFIISLVNACSNPNSKPNHDITETLEGCGNMG